jgi:hypothetical protein
MRCFLRILVAVAATGAGPAHAISFDANYESDRERETGLASTGFSAAVSQGLGEHFFASASYSRLRTDPFDDGDVSGRVEYVSGGVDLGAGYSLTEGADLSMSVGYAGSETRGLDGFEDDPVQRVHGPSGSLMVSVRPHKWTWLFLGPSYSYVGGVPGWQGTAGLRLRLLRTLWFSTSYWGSEAMDGWNAGLRKDFGAD